VLHDRGMTDPRRIAVLAAGTSTPSSSSALADRLAAATLAALDRRGVAASTTRIEVRDLAHDIADATLTRLPGERLAQALDAVVTADAVIAVSPTFNGSYGGLFKAFVDLLEPTALAGLPVVLGATGGSERHSLVLDHALRPLFSYLHALVLPTGVYAAAADWAATDGVLQERVARAGEELAAAVAARPARGSGSDAFADADFEDLLRALD
jgi:FMN reductase